MTEPGIAPAPSAPVSGLVYADVPNRAIAYIIDSIIVAVVIVVIASVLAGVGLATSTISATAVIETNYVATIILGLIGIAISGAYFVYTWTSMRATIGMKVLGMQIGNAGDGKTLTTDQAIRRFAAVSAPSVIAQVFQPVPLIGPLLGLVAFGWIIYLLYTTAKSPTKQGWHDIFANTQVVKALKAV
jgi:uncharacterized RDD family membrane protein YckC